MTTGTFMTQADGSILELAHTMNVRGGRWEHWRRWFKGRVISSWVDFRPDDPGGGEGSSVQLLMAA